jgi:scyllo-inositol 2-dehydrogenase (NADP+)
MIDQALLLFGMPEAISADIVAQRAEAQVDDYFDLTLHYGPRRVCLRCSTLVSEPRPRFAVHASGGSFVKFGLDPQEEQLKSGIAADDARFGTTDMRGTLTSRDGTRANLPTERGDWRAFYEQVADAILDGTPAPVAPADARAGLMLIDLARRAVAEGRLLPVPAASSPAA